MLELTFVDFVNERLFSAKLNMMGGAYPYGALSPEVVVQLTGKKGVSELPNVEVIQRAINSVPVVRAFDESVPHLRFHSQHRQERVDVLRRHAGAGAAQTVARAFAFVCSIVRILMKTSNYSFYAMRYREDARQRWESKAMRSSGVIPPRRAPRRRRLSF